MKSEVKENVQGTNSKGKETGTQIKGMEEINIQPEQNEETRTQKNEESLRNPQGNFRCCPVRMWGKVVDGLARW